METFSAPQVSGASFSNFDMRVSAADNKNITASAQTSYAPNVAGGDGSTINVTSSDYGLVSAASAMYAKATDLVYGSNIASQITARQALASAQETVSNQGAGALKLITKPFIWVAAIVAAVLIFAIYRKKGA